MSSLELDYPVVPVGDSNLSVKQQGVRAEDDVGEKVKVAIMVSVPLHAFTAHMSAWS